MTMDALKQLPKRFDDLNLRERVLILVAVLVVVHLVWSQWLWEPLNKNEKALDTKISEAQQQVSILEMELKGLVARSEKDPNVAIRQEISQIESQVSQLQQRIERAAGSLISPAQMTKLLEEVLVRNKALKMVNLTTLKSESILGTQITDGEQGEASQTSAVNVYRHGFAIEFEGDYLSTLKYLQSLEEIPWAFFWDGVSLQVESYPRSKVKLMLHTLSLSERWIGV